MRKRLLLLCLYLMCFCSITVGSRNLVSSVDFEPMGDYIRIYYQFVYDPDVSVVKNVRLSFSKDGGKTFVPVKEVIGDVGTVNTEGEKVIDWYPFKEFGNDDLSGDLTFKISGSPVMPPQRWIEYTMMYSAWVGLTYGYMKTNIGVYARFACTPLPIGIKRASEISSGSELYGPFSEAKDEVARLSGTAGAFVRLKPWWYMYGGGGYAKFWQLYDAEYNSQDAERNFVKKYLGPEIEAGMILLSKGGFSFSFGYIHMFGDQNSRGIPAFTLGIGSIF